MLRRFVREVVCARADEPCDAIATTMRDRRVGAVVVVEGRRPIGIVTDRDLAVRVVAEGRDPTTTRASAVMTETPVTLDASAGIETALATMRASGVRRLPLTDEAGALVGIVTYDDLVVPLARELAEIGEGIEGNVDAPELR
jgi:CBS domain-containing protein